MKIAFVEMAGFRGFKARTRFNFPKGFAVLTGRNGTGKSTVLDAVDYVLTGTINKYVVKGAKGGGLDDHIWWVGESVAEKQYVTVGLVDESGQEIVMTRSRERGLETPVDDITRGMYQGDSAAAASIETLMQTSLIRDETLASLSLDAPEQARFSYLRAALGGLAGPNHAKRTKRTAALLEAATVARTAQASRVAAIQVEIGRVQEALTEARSLAGRQADVAEAEQTIRSLAPDLAGATGERAEVLRRHIADRKQSIALLSAAITRAEGLQAELRHFGSDIGKAEVAAARSELVVAQQAKARVDESLVGALRLEAAERESDVFASHLVALLDHGEAVGLQAGHCPLCAVVRRPEDFAAAIMAARSKLSTRGAGTTRASAAVEQARLEVEQIGKVLFAAEQRLERLEARRNGALRDAESVAATFGQWRLAASPSDPAIARSLLHQRQEETARLEHAIFILEASGAHDRVVSLEGRVTQLRAHLDEETAKLTAALRAVEATKQIHNAVTTVANQLLKDQFDTVTPLLKELYQRLRPHREWPEIEIDFGGEVRASLNFTVGNGRNPQFLFSSGQRRAAGIAFLLAIHLSRPWCRLHSLLLDDPVQHIDDYRALNLVEVLSAVRRSGRQVIVAVEDPSLADLLCRRLRSTAVDGGRRFELISDKNGSAGIEREVDIFPHPRQTLTTAVA